MTAAMAPKNIFPMLSRKKSRTGAGLVLDEAASVVLKRLAVDWVSLVQPVVSREEVTMVLRTSVARNNLDEATALLAEAESMIDCSLCVVCSS